MPFELWTVIRHERLFKVGGEVIVVGEVEPPADANQVSFLFEPSDSSSYGTFGASEPGNQPRDWRVAVQGIDVPVARQYEEQEPFVS